MSLNAMDLIGDAEDLTSLGLGNFQKAVEAYKKGLAVDPTVEALKSGLADALSFVSSPFGVITEENVLKKLWENPRTEKWMKDFVFHGRMLDIISMFGRSPILVVFDLKGADERVVQAVGFLLSDQTEDEMVVPPGMDLVAVPPGTDFDAAPRDRESGRMNLVARAKAKGDAAFSSRDFAAAVGYYTEGISLAPNTHVLFSNRSDAHASLDQFEEAVSDAKKAIELKPVRAEGYIRLGHAHYNWGLQQFQNAVDCYQKTLDLLDNSSRTLWDDLYGLIYKLENYSMLNPCENALRRPDMFKMLRESDRTSGFMEQADFVNMMEELEKKPTHINLYLKDDRVIQALCVLFNSPEE